MSKQARERVSETLNLKYVTLNDSYMTEDGVLLMKSECQGIQSAKLLKLYNERLSEGILYDYFYAKSTGAKRRKRYTATDNFVKIEELREVAKVTEEVGDTRIITALRILMLMVGAMSTIVTGVNLHNALSQSLDSNVALLFAVAMAIFLTGSFESFIIFKRKRMYGLASIIVACFAITVTYSITAEMEVMYRGYASREVERLNNRADVDKEAIAAVMLIDDFDRDIKSAEDRLYLAVEEYKRYSSLDTVSTWRVAEMQNKIDTHTKSLSELRAEKRKIIEDNTDSVVVKSKKEEAPSFFDFIEDTFGVSARKIRFFRDMLPALFIDFISPISVSVAMFMGVSYGKRKRKCSRGKESSFDEEGISSEGYGSETKENTDGERVRAVDNEGGRGLPVSIRERLNVSRIFGTEGGKKRSASRSSTSVLPEQKAWEVQHTGSAGNTDDLGKVSDGI